MASMQDVFSYVVFPILTLLQIGAAYWVYTAQSKRNEAMDKAVESFRKYEGDLRSQLADQKTSVETASQVVNTLKASYDAVQANQNKLLESAQKDLDEANQKIIEQQTSQLDQIATIKIDPALAELLTTMINESASSQEQLLTLSSTLQELISSGIKESATRTELLIKNSSYDSSHITLGSKNGQTVLAEDYQNFTLFKMHRQVRLQRTKYACEALVKDWLVKNNINGAPFMHIKWPELVTECKQKFRSIQQEYNAFDSNDIALIASELLDELKEASTIPAIK